MEAYNGIRIDNEVIIVEKHVPKWERDHGETIPQG